MNLPTEPTMAIGSIPADPVVAATLDEAGLSDDLVALGVSVAETMIECIEATDIPVCMVGLLTALPTTQLTRRLENLGFLFDFAICDLIAILISIFNWETEVFKQSQGLLIVFGGGGNSHLQTMQFFHLV